MNNKTEFLEKYYTEGLSIENLNRGIRVFFRVIERLCNETGLF